MSVYKDDADRAPAPSNNSQAPSILNIKSMATNQLMRYSSDVLEPLSFSQSECVFRLQPRGFLHPNSAISIGFEANATINDAFPYIGTGIHSLIRRAVLRTTAGRVINDTDSWNMLESVKSSFVQNSTNKEREQFLNGRQLDYEIVYDVGSDVSSTRGYGLSNGYEYCESTIGGNREGLSSRPELRLERDPEFQIKLHNLFEYCKQGNQFPLFLLPNEQIEVVLYWDFTDLKSRLALPASGDGNIAQTINIDRKKCKFIANYSFYDGKIMDSFREEYAKGLTFAYTDYRLSKQSVNQAGAINNVRNVGGNGMAIDNVYWYVEKNGENATSLLGKFHGVAPEAQAVAGKPERQLLTSNLFVNSEFLFPQSITNSARQFHNLKETAGMIPFIPRAIYSGQGVNALVNTAPTEFEGRALQNQLAGKGFYQGFRLKGLSQKVDNRGIDVHSDMALEDHDHTQNCWIEARRYVVISDGHLEVYYM
tara:strand:+ start:119 stop:1558 length:1440 start_codon:yes stop_codon:yes gene_type:complete